MKRFALGLLGIVLTLPLLGTQMFAQGPPPDGPQGAPTSNGPQGMPPSDGPHGMQPSEMQKMREMHEKHEAAMKADMDKMKSILDQMKSNLNSVKSKDPAVQKQLQLNVDMWQAFADHMNHMQEMHKQMGDEMKKHMGEGRGHGMRHHGDHPDGPPPSDQMPPPPDQK